MISTRPFNAYLDTLTEVAVLLPKHYYSGKSSAFYIESGGNVTKMELVGVQELNAEIKYTCRLKEMPEFGREHVILDERLMRTDLQMGGVIRTKEFDRLFYYEGELGSMYTPEKTSFRVWAPTATEAFVKFKETEEAPLRYMPMRRGPSGTFEAEINGNAEGFFYHYQVRVNNIWHEAVDPYAKMVSVHSEWARVVDDEKMKVEKHQLPPFSSPLDAIIYEASIRDVSSQRESGIKHQGLYLGLTEEGTQSPDGQPTGLDYITSLGVTHVQLMPFFDFFGVSDTDFSANYNWGYNPLYFNVPEGSFSSNPADLYARSVELKQMIEAFHKKGLRVIMDVVYNHVFVRETSSFEKLVPGYFFRQGIDGMPSNGSGCGNDFASERKMGRKFILDSLQYWMEAYNLDGFRFDLMGLIDVETMKQAASRLRRHNLGLILLGEGWDLNTALPAEEKATIRNEHALPEVAFFNDRFRDSIKGSTFQLFETGFAFGNSKMLDNAFAALTANVGCSGVDRLFHSPAQSVNYVECHDNYTLWDKLEACFPGDTETNKKRHLLATAIVLFSQGIPFLHAGQEFCRTKHGVENSYTSSDIINQMDWRRRGEFVDHVQYVKGLIEVRKSTGAFRLRKEEAICYHMVKWPANADTLTVWLKDVGSYGKWKDLVLSFNTGKMASTFALPEGEEWHQIVSGTEAGTKPLQTVKQDASVEPFSCAVFAR
ncbi:type I pullulanase [Domibacillus sp. DTU_2020_1001157_1_SI_ALB_TIR_016]|uniref:type I pullulanase n=1 Tax=Domibacillus sp. DTU_2020_1001157_1_SI_ALB_TIR_016 TaxID=3077789 RepID=UPI0028E8DD42|nr:type I pullulanase [Domibacillus sp. DTU_2020_1001157_1_SI_ALB_TIR_016]WNS81698.1 type I pullulanase [Domibacillus sp. DTU_2020_1001157_1_SI_ALB_TIR_016]